MSDFYEISWTVISAVRYLSVRIALNIDFSTTKKISERRVAEMLLTRIFFILFTCATGTNNFTL